MNRPFGAFGALLALLTLAMFAVSSPERSTTVQEQPVGRAQRLVSQQLGTSSEMTPASSGAFECDGSEDDSWWDADAAGQELSPLARGGGTAATMASARIQCAENTNAALTQTATDDDVSRACRTAELPAEGLPGIDSDWLATFQSLVVPAKSRPASQSGAAYTPRSGSPGPIVLTAATSISLFDRGALNGGLLQSRSFVNAFVRWMLQRADQLVQDYGLRGSEPAVGKIMGWDEYAELIDGASPGGSASAFAKRTSEPFRGVRSSGWLRHSAASSLYQLGLFLQAAGLELSGAALQ